MRRSDAKSSRICRRIKSRCVDLKRVLGRCQGFRGLWFRASTWSFDRYRHSVVLEGGGPVVVPELAVSKGSVFGPVTTIDTNLSTRPRRLPWLLLLVAFLNHTLPTGSAFNHYPLQLLYQFLSIRQGPFTLSFTHFVTTLCSHFHALGSLASQSALYQPSNLGAMP